MIRAGLRAADSATIVVNPDYPLGQLSSMQCGLRAVPEKARGVLFTLVDHPAVRDSTIVELFAPAAAVVMPRYQGRRGHPIYFSSALVPQFLALDSRSSAKAVLERYSSEIQYVDVDDPAILDDVDDREAYGRLLRAHDAQA